MIFIDYPLVWTQQVVDKIWQKHHVAAEEVEEVIFDNKQICHRGALNSYCVYGQSLSGRYLLIILRKKGRGALYKVITARDLTDKEKKYYRKN